jgi:hypothetical protein
MSDELATSRTIAFATAPSPQEIFIYSHSTLLYWWPAWVLGFVFALTDATREKLTQTGQPSSALGLTYVLMLLLLIIFTNARFRGINSIVVLTTGGFIAVLLAWLGWWDDIVRLIPHLSVQMNTGFYWVFSSGLLIIWLAMFFLFDRMTYWRVRPGQVTEEHWIGGGAHSFSTSTLRFEKLNSDLFRTTLGLGAGDLRATGAGDHGRVIDMPNVIFVSRKVAAIEKLIAVRPDHIN